LTFEHLVVQLYAYVTNVSAIMLRDVFSIYIT